MNENARLDTQVLELDQRRGEMLLGKIYALLGRFIAYPSEHAKVAHALWIAHAHLMDKWDSTPRIAFLSPEPGSGKSRALDITEMLVPRPVKSVNVSPAYLFRKVAADDGRPTILFDEIDTVFGPKARENEEIRGLLNAGHRKGATAGRCVVVGKTVTTEELPAYAAVALAGLGWLPDTIMTRSVIVRMRKRRSDEHVDAFRPRIHEPAGHTLRDQIATWAASQLDDVAWPEMPPQIQDRDADVWEPLLAIADMVGGEWPARSRAAAVSLVASGKEAELSLGVRLLGDLRVIFGDSHFVSTGEILAALHVMDEAPWGDLNGKPLDAQRLARRLKEYDIRPEVARITSSATARGYRRASLEDAWARYLPRAPAGSVTSETPATATANRGAVADVADVTHLPGHGRPGLMRLPREDDDDEQIHLLDG